MEVKIKAVCFLIFTMFFGSRSSAQVQSNAFNLTLKALLSHTVAEVTVRQIKDMPEAMLLDAREKKEYEVSHIANAKFVGYKKFEIETLKETNKKQKIVVYCSVGFRIGKVSEKLKQAGFA